MSHHIIPTSIIIDKNPHCPLSSKLSRPMGVSVLLTFAKCQTLKIYLIVGKIYTSIYIGQVFHSSF